MIAQGPSHSGPGVSSLGEPQITYAIYLADLNREATDSHGVLNYAIHLVGRIPRLLRDNERLLVYSNAQVRGELPDADVQHFVLRSEGSFRRLWWDQASWYLARRQGVNVLHYPKGYVPFSLGRGPTTVATLHDDIVLQYVAGRWRHPQPNKARYFAWQTKHAIKTADFVLTDSEFSRDRLLEWANRWGRDDLSPVVTYIGPTSSPAVDERRGDRPYYLVFGSPFPHKRSPEAIEFLLRFLDRVGLTGEVRVIGHVDQRTEDPRVVSVGSGLPGMEVSGLIGSAEAVVTASEYEGFGLAPLDAHHLGTGAVFAQCATARELYDWLPGSYVPGDFESFCTAIETVTCMSPAERAVLAREAAGRFSWDRVAQSVVYSYRAAAYGAKVDRQSARKRGTGQ